MRTEEEWMEIISHAVKRCVMGEHGSMRFICERLAEADKAERLLYSKGYENGSFLELVNRIPLASKGK